MGEPTGATMTQVARICLMAGLNQAELVAHFESATDPEPDQEQG